MNAVALILAFAFAVFMLWLYGCRFLKSKWYGTETEAVVSRIEEETGFVRGIWYSRRFWYVRFQTQDGMQNEVRLLNPKGYLHTGSRIRIRYLPENGEYAIFTEEIRST